jgi:hypothetical protein
MKTIEATARVAPDGTLSLQVPTDLKAGRHRAVVIVDENPRAAQKARSLKLPLHDVGPWPKALSLRREDMYGDDGR